MNHQNLLGIVQVVTGLAVLAGLLLVVYELRQAKDLALAELTSQGYAETMEDYRTVLGEESAATLARACLEPDTLSAEDFQVLNAYYTVAMLHIERLRVLELVAEFGVPWQLVAKGTLSGILSTGHGRWWAAQYVAPDPELKAIIDDIEPRDCRVFFEAFRSQDRPASRARAGLQAAPWS